MEENPHRYEGWEEDLPDEPEFSPRPLAVERNSPLFAMLANVNNGRFLREEVSPIALPRGLPPDVSPELASWSATWGEDGHDHSWLTLEELLAYDWSQVAKCRGVVDPSIAHRFEGDPLLPMRYSTAADGRGTRVVWRETYRSLAGPHFFDVLLPHLRSLGAPDEVRIVFWFDS